jgi:rhodanese-related sulfurtransferase/signal-transduction protein with cAMP-binding, CBS, and nucleotidyltransferase domain
MISVKFERIVKKLFRNYFPFTMLSRLRLTEVVNVVRFIELRAGEIFQMKGSKGYDYLYVIEGSIEIILVDGKTISGPQETRRKPIVLPPIPDTSTVLAKENSIICHADREMLDNLMSWDEIVQQMSDSGNELAKRLNQVRNSLVFRRLPLEKVELAFKKMRTIHAPKGQNVINQGEEGDAYYIITQGTAEVYRTGIYDDELKKVADLKDGDAFGCEALISGKKRSETVTMTADGKLLVLGKKDFKELISIPLIKTVHPKIARTMLETGYKLVDVRYNEEYKEHHIPNTILIPLNELRNRLDELNREDRYIIYCHSGNRSAVAALFLTENQFDVVSLEGGIRDWPFETIQQKQKHNNA